MLLEQLIAAKLDVLFPGMEVLAHHPFRVTRDADFELEDEAEDLLEAIESVLRRRSKFGRVVRLEVDTKMTAEVLELLCRELELSDADVNVIDGPLDLGGLWSHLRSRPARAQGRAVGAADPAPPPGQRPPARLLPAAAGPPTCSCTTPTTRSPRRSSSSSSRPRATRSVLAIKQTIYRTAGAESALVASLVKAAEQGKQVVALVELKARFDEQANIARARVLEEAGVHVVYGLVGLKTHAKVLLVVRQEADGIRRYCHVGTGNYNPKTADLYEDLGLLSADPDLGADLTDLFNHLTGYSHQGTYRKLLVAPVAPAPRDRRSHRAAGGPGRGRPHHHEDEQPGRPGADRHALRRVAAGHRDRPRRAGHLLPATPGAGPVREHPGAVDRRVASSSTPGSTASAPTPKPPSTSSVRPT